MAFLGSFSPASLPQIATTAATTGRVSAITGPLPAALGTLATGARLSGVAMALQANGQQKIRTPFGVLTLTPRTPFPAGGSFLFELAGMPTRPQLKLIALTPPAPATAAPPTAAAAQGAAAAALSHRWTGLEKLLNEAGGKNPAQGALAAALPRPGAGLTRALITFIATLRSGGLEPLLGRALALSLLSQPRLGPLARALHQDMAHLERFALDPGPGAWQGLFAPLIVGGQYHQLRIFTRRDGAPEETEPKAKLRRFIVETELPALGPIQLDGLMAADTLDLVMRCTTALPATWQSNLRLLVGASAARAGIIGKIGFQICDKFPVAPLEDGLLGTEAQGILA